MCLKSLQKPQIVQFVSLCPHWCCCLLFINVGCMADLVFNPDNNPRRARRSRYVIWDVMHVVKVTRNRYLVLVPDIQKRLVGVLNVPSTDSTQNKEKWQKKKKSIEMESRKPLQPCAPPSCHLTNLVLYQRVPPSFPLGLAVCYDGPCQMQHWDAAILTEISSSYYILIKKHQCENVEKQFQNLFDITVSCNRVSGVSVTATPSPNHFFLLYVSSVRG